MDIEVLEYINKNNIEAAKLLIESGQKEVELAKTFPLIVFPQLLEATKIDLKISKKMLKAAIIEKEAIEKIKNADKNGYKLFKVASDKRLLISNDKYEASKKLTNLAALQTINEEMNSHFNSKSRKKSKSRTNP